MDATAAGLAPWGGGKELLQKLYASLGLNVVLVPIRTDADPAASWFKKPMTKVEDFAGMKYRTVGISSTCSPPWRRGERATRGENRVAIDRGLPTAAEVSTTHVRSRPRFRRRLQGLHAQSTPEREQLEITLQQDQVRCTARQDEGDHRQCGHRASRR